MKRFIHSMAVGLALVGLLGVASSPADAAADATTGVVAALGLTAAGGKTTLAGGAGSIEASLIETQALNEAGWVIARLVAAQLPSETSKKIVLLARSDQVDLSAVSSMMLNLQTLQTNLDQLVAVPCGKAPPPKPGPTVKDLTPGSIATSLPSILATDTSVAGLTLSADDRVLVEAIMMNASGSSPAGWQDANAAAARSAVVAGGPSYVLPSESLFATTDVARSQLLTRFEALQASEAARRICTDDSSKAALAAADSFIAKATTIGDKGTPSPLTLALEQEAFLKAGDGGAIETPDVLRVAIEQNGGTSITRSGILYTLGLPDAAVVTSGLVVSFRLVDPSSGRPKLTGFVRCAAKPINFKKVQAALHDGKEAVACSFVSNAPPKTVTPAD